MKRAQAPAVGKRVRVAPDGLRFSHRAACTEAALEGGRVALPNRAAVYRVSAVRSEPRPGCTGGGLLSGPVTYETGPGRIETGDWSERGLEAWSSGVRYRTTIRLERRPAGEVELDWGRVRGSAEVLVNGKPAGGPASGRLTVFEWGPRLQASENTIEVLV